MSNDPMAALRPHLNTPITDAARANEALIAAYRADADGLAIAARGRVRLSSIIPGFALVIHEIYPTEADVQQLGKRGFAYKASFLRRLLDSAGLSIVAEDRRDDGTDPRLREFEVTLEGVDLQLQRRRWTGRYELDLRDGNARAAAIKNQRMLDEKLQHINQLAATGALTRAIVEALAIQRGFQTAADAMRPILLPSMTIYAAGAPPEVQAQITAAAIGAAFGAFGPTPAATLPAPQPVSLPPTTTMISATPAGLEPPIGDDDVPFADDDAAAADAVADRPITDAERAELEARKLWRRDLLSQAGWSGEGPVPVSVYHRMIGGA